MTSGPPDWMRGGRMHRYGGPKAPGRGPTSHGLGQSGPDLYGTGPRGSQNPYAVGVSGARPRTGDGPAPRGDAPSGRFGAGNGTQNTSGRSGHDQPAHGTAPPDAAAHYVPGSPAAAPLGSDGSKRPGLVALAVLLVLGSLAFLVWHSATWLEPLVDALDQCPVERGMACFTNEPFQRWVYAPVLAVVIAWGFASGAATEGRQGRARGYLHLLAGVAVLIVGGLVSSL